MALNKPQRPVPALDIVFEWQPQWEAIFDEHAQLIRGDIIRALADDRLVVYLSCPISSRGSSVVSTNLEVAGATAARLTREWGDRFWFLNPAQYQLESEHGQGLLERHAKQLGVDVAVLKKSPPTGGDYMRMWTKVLAEDDDDNLGGRFAAYYFIGPSDYRRFFGADAHLSLTDAIEGYFAREFAANHGFHQFFGGPFVVDGQPVADARAEWNRRRKEFIRYYAVRAGAAFSKGSHDEWNIWVALNRARMASKKHGIGEQIPGFFDGLQIDPASARTPIEAGYAGSNELPRQVPEQRPPNEATSREKAAAALGDLAKKLKV